MTLEQIEYFVAAVENGSFSAAAEQMFVSHSSVSRGVSVLESELGVQLLIRGRRTLVRTEAGEVFYRRGKAFLQQARMLKNSVAEYQLRQQLRFISVGLYAPRFFEMCRGFQTAHPTVEFIMEQGGQRDVVEKIRNGGADMGATFSYSIPPGSGFDALVLEQGCFCALASPRHELAGREYLTDEELAARRDILGENPFYTERDARRELSRDLHSNLLQIKTGNGITVLPEHAAAEFGHGCVQIPIRGKLTTYQLELVWDRENTSRALAEAVAFFREQIH